MLDTMGMKMIVVILIVIMIVKWRHKLKKIVASKNKKNKIFSMDDINVMGNDTYFNFFICVSISLS